MNLTNQQRKAKSVVAQWVQANQRGVQVIGIRHIYPRALVVGHLGPRALVVARPWQDSEPQCREWDRQYPLDVIHDNFDKSLKAGDWCIVAYVSTDTSGLHYAVPTPAETMTKPKRRRKQAAEAA